MYRLTYSDTAVEKVYAKNKKYKAKFEHNNSKTFPNYHGYNSGVTRIERKIIPNKKLRKNNKYKEQTAEEHLQEILSAENKNWKW